MNQGKENANLAIGQVRRVAEIAVTLLILCGLIQGCLSPRQPSVRTVLPAEQADSLIFIPGGRFIIHSALYESERRGLLLDVATGQETAVPKEWDTLSVLGEDLLFGGSQQQGYYVLSLPTMATIKLEPLSSEVLSGVLDKADAIFVINTYPIVGNEVEEQHEILLLQHELSGKVTQGYYVEGVRDLAPLLAGVSYKTPPAPYRCSSGKVPSPDGQYYYTIGDTLQIYSQEGALLNTAPRSHPGFDCYGWAWDSSGVYFQEWGRSWMSQYVGPLQLLLANPEHEK